MALQAWDKQLRTEIESLKLENEGLIQQLMIGGGGNRPGEDGPYREPPPGEAPPYPPRIAHGEHFNRYGEIIGDPTKGHADPAGNPITIPHLEQSPQEKIDNLKIHNENFPNRSHGPMISDHRATTNYLDSQGRSGRTGSFRDSGLTDKELKEALMIGIQLMKA